MKKSEFLKYAWGRISDPRRWIRHAYRSGNTYCMVGAMNAAADDLWLAGILSPDEAASLRDEVYADLARELHGCIEGYNDSHTWAQLRDRVMRAVRIMERDEGPTIGSPPPIKLEVQENPVLKPQQPKVVHVKSEQAQKQAVKEAELA